MMIEFPDFFRIIRKTSPQKRKTCFIIGVECGFFVHNLKLLPINENKDDKVCVFLRPQMVKYLLRFFAFISLTANLHAQFDEPSSATTGDIRGFVYNAENGDRISGASVYVLQGKRTATTDADGFFAITNLAKGTYSLQCYLPGFDTLTTEVKVVIGANARRDFFMTAVQRIGSVEITAKAKSKEVQVATQTIDAKTLSKMPAVGAEPDLVQYLQILPGVVFSGDQGGQLYIRGGSPVMNKITLDGMTIYNPFHSIGLFSVFDPDLMQTADVYTAGFGAEYGGRISAIVDVKTRDGNRNRFKTKLGLNTFTSKVLVEGPIKKFKAGESNSSFAVSYRNSFLKQSSKLLYQYANPEKLPYNFGDLFVKFSSNSASGGYTKLYGFYFTDVVDFEKTTKYEWASYGVGGKFLVVPDQSKTRVDGFFLYSNYAIKQIETDNKPRSSDIGGFNLGMNFTYNFTRDALKWGMEINGFQTNFQIYNSNNRRISQLESTTEINAFTTYKFARKKFIADLGVRTQYYASLGNGSFEPRLQMRYMLSPGWGVKMAAGMYSQNLLSAISDRDVVNLFYGFLSGPDNLPETFNNKAVEHRLQKANHLVLGTDYRLTKFATINLEGFVKIFTQITNINRDKLFDDDEFNQDKTAQLRQDFILETGDAYGGDISYKYSKKGLYIWAVYSLTYVNRFDGRATYQPVFDRRHNANFLVSYEFDKKNPTEISVRWNLGSGFPFTQTQGYYEKYTFDKGIGTDYTTENGDLGILYASLNKGRLPYYHRLDFSVSRKWKFEDKSEFNLIFSVINVYDRNNIFYFDRIQNIRVDQLPFLPSIGCNYSF
jgi:hypothetical protein